MYSKKSNRSTEREESKLGNIDKLIKNLASKDGILRVKSRYELVCLGESGLKQLTQAVSDKNQTVRWEATKALGQIAASMTEEESIGRVYQNAVKALVAALEDRNFDVRWLAAEALIAVGNSAIVPVLEVLETNPGSLVLREGAHHVFHDLAHRTHVEDLLLPVITALEDPSMSIEVPFIAKSLKDKIKAD
jgi:HEAT repeat protein